MHVFSPQVMQNAVQNFISLHLFRYADAAAARPNRVERESQRTTTGSMANSNLKEAKAAKNDEFYTQFHDIEIEMNAYLEYDPNVFRGKTILLPCDDPEWSNFTRYFAAKFDEFGLKKLISTSYAPDAKKIKFLSEPTLFETAAPQFDPSKTQTKGKIFVLDKDISGDGKINIDDLHWESDFIITNPPFSLFREFLAWIMGGGEKKFIIIGNMNCITYKEVFPLIMNNKIWLGIPFPGGNAYFRPAMQNDYAVGVYDEDTNLVKFRNCIWLTNVDHGRRHQPLSLMTMADNLRYSRHKEIRGKETYDHYDNYDAIEVPFTDAIPSDYDGVMGVPISFLDKYCPEQFEILGMASSAGYNADIVGLPFKGKKDARPLINGENRYARVFIKHISLQSAYE